MGVRVRWGREVWGEGVRGEGKRLGKGRQHDLAEFLHFSDY